MIVGARRRRAEVGSRVKLHVVIYRTEQGTRHWAFTLTDDHQKVIARSSSTRLDDLGMKWELLVAALHLLLDVRIAEAGTRLVRDDERWDVAVRLVDGRDELPFRVS
jgi:hypothetical protein